MLDLAAGLVAEGLEVGLLSTPIPAAYRNELAAAGITCHEVAGVSPGRYSPAYFRAVGPAIERLTAAGAFDIVHGQEFGLGLWRGPAPGGPRLVLTVHGTLTSETALHPDLFRALSLGGRLWALRRYGRRFLFGPAWHRMLDRAERILVDSEFTAKELRRIRRAIAPRTRVVPLGVDMRRYPGLDAAAARSALGWRAGGPPQLITVGRLEWQKGHDIALEALATLRDLEWDYWIVGEGSAEAGLRRRIGELGLGDRVRLTGRVDAETKRRMLAAADLFLWPERTHPAFGLVGLEALLMETPVLAARRGAIPEVVDADSGWLHDPESPAALAAALGPLLREPARLGRMAAGLRERTLRRFAPAAMARGTLDVYRELY